eukprot:2896182-Pleurochrysis_carterae.AAC.1
MSIPPFECRAFAIKPHVAFNKTRMEPRAWVGINLGRSLASPGAYSVYVPSVPRVVLTAEEYFGENTYPRKPASSAPASPVAAVTADAGTNRRDYLARRLLRTLPLASTRCHATCPTRDNRPTTLVPFSSSSRGLSNDPMAPRRFYVKPA